MSRSRQLLVYGLFVASGATALIYEVTWLRNLSLIFGASHQATSIVLAAFMGGMSLGGLTFGRLAGRFSSPLRVYGVLEIAIAGFAIVMPGLLRAVDAVYVAAVAHSEGTSPLVATMRALMAFSLLALPAFLMGGTLPVLTQEVVRNRDELGVRLSWLYGSNTLGAVLGTLSAGFVLVPHLGVWRAQLVAVAVNVAIGVVAVAAGSRAAAPATLEHKVRPEPSVDPGERRALQLVFYGTALAGFSALALEVLWTRAISLAVGTTTYSFTVMLAAFLTGIALGSWLHALVPLNRVPVPVQFGIVLGGAGLASLAASAWIPRLPDLAIRVNLALYDDLTRTRPGTALVLAFLVMLVPCLFMGLAFPLANQARSALTSGFGRSAGDTLAWNTFGSITGSLAAGFVLIPVLGLQQGMFFASVLYLVYAAVVLGVLGAARLPARRSLVLASSLVAVLLAFLLPFAIPAWDIGLLGAFNNKTLKRYVTSTGAADVKAALSGSTVQYYREGHGSTVSVTERAGQRSLLVNGRAVASDHAVDLRHELLLGHIPVLMHPDPRSALVIGLGAGVTLGAITTHREIEEIVLVEIEPALLGAARLFEPVNADALDDPRLTVVLEDGRNFLKIIRRSFDVITADPIHPWTRGSAYLYTREYYEQASARLTENGVMCQWLPFYGLSDSDFRSVVATFAAAFEQTQLWQTTGDLILIGSRGPLHIDSGSLERRIAQPRVAEQLRQIGLDDALSFLAELAMETDAVTAYAGDGLVNTDDNLYLEFSSPLSMGTDFNLDNLRAIDAAREGMRVLPPGDPREAVLIRYQRAKSATTWAELGLRRADERVWAEDQLRTVVRELPAYGPARIQLAEHLASRATNRLSTGDVDAADRDSREALALVPDQPEALRVLGAVSIRQGNLVEAIEVLERSRLLRPRHWLTYAFLGDALFRAGRPTEAVEVLREGAAIDPANALLREQLERVAVP